MTDDDGNSGNSIKR